MQTQHDAESQPVHAEGEIIVYYKEEDRVHIRRNAKLEQDGSIVRSDSIEYFINQELVKAVSDDPVNGEAAGRVRVIIPPSRLAQDEQE
jgi:lipopolysaccharide export system protein LptA